jgi:hypothetical protein
MEADAQAMAAVTAIAETNERMLALAREWKSSAGVLKVCSECVLRHYASPGVACEFYVDVMFEDGGAVTWWLDLRINEPFWVVEPQILTMINGVQETLKELPSRRTSDTKGMIEHLRAAVSELEQHSSAYMKGRSHV